MEREYLDFTAETEAIFNELEDCIAEIIKEEAGLIDIFSMDEKEYALLSKMMKAYKRSKDMAIESIRRQEKYDDYLKTNVELCVKQNAEILRLLNEQEQEKKIRKEDKRGA